MVKALAQGLHQVDHLAGQLHFGRIDLTAHLAQLVDLIDSADLGGVVPKLRGFARIAGTEVQPGPFIERDGVAANLFAQQMPHFA